MIRSSLAARPSQQDTSSEAHGACVGLSGRDCTPPSSVVVGRASNAGLWRSSEKHLISERQMQLISPLQFQALAGSNAEGFSEWG